MADCVFCKIIKKEIPTSVITENDHVIVFKDLHPKAPIHYLVVPKIHIENLNFLDIEKHGNVIKEIFGTIVDLSKKLPDPKAFTLISNNGAESGQSVFHMHWHFLSGKNLYSCGGIRL